MTATARRLPITCLVAQIGVTLCAFSTLAFWPPARGRMLLVPVTGGTLVRTINLAIAGGGRLVGAGPIAGSLVVDGVRAELAGPMNRAGILILAAPPAGCGGSGPA